MSSRSSSQGTILRQDTEQPIRRSTSVQPAADTADIAEELIELVERMAEKAAASAQGGPSEEPQVPAARPAFASPPAGTANVFNLEDALTHCGDEQIFRSMTDFFFCESTTLVDQMRVALGSGDALTISRAAHRLKGTVVFLGARPAVDAADQVERLDACRDMAAAAAAINRLEEQLELLRRALSAHRP